MQADIEQLKTQIQTPESDPAKAIDLATQIIAQARFHIWCSPIGIIKVNSDWLRVQNTNLKTFFRNN